MTVPQLLQSAKVLRKLGDSLGAFALALNLVGAASKRVSQDKTKAQNDGEAYSTYLADMLAEHGIPNIAVDFETPRILSRSGKTSIPATPARVLYHLYRCNLSHEGALAEDATIVDGRAPRFRFLQDRVEVSTGLIDLLLHIIETDPRLARDFGRTATGIRFREGVNDKTFYKEIANLYGLTEDRIRLAVELFELMELAAR